MILLVVSAILGGSLSGLLLWPYGTALALIGAPLGGSCWAALAAGALWIRRRAA